jgi:hypothetical protein
MDRGEWGHYCSADTDLSFSYSFEFDDDDDATTGYSTIAERGGTGDVSIQYMLQAQTYDLDPSQVGAVTAKFYTPANKNNTVRHARVGSVMRVI